MAKNTVEKAKIDDKWQKLVYKYFSLCEPELTQEPNPERKETSAYSNMCEGNYKPFDALSGLLTKEKAREEKA